MFTSQVLYVLRFRILSYTANIWLGSEADHSPPTGTEVKDARSYISTPPYIHMAHSLVKYCRSHDAESSLYVG